MRMIPKPDDCNHIIGLLRHRDYSELATLDKLLSHIHYRNEWNDMIRSDPNFVDLQHMLMQDFTLKHYCDFRISTNLTRFNHCPLCGTQIDWSSIKEIKV